MHFDEIIGYCRTLAQDYTLAAVTRWKESHPDSKAIGYFPVYTPGELIHALDLLPVGVFGGGNLVEIEQADSRIQSFVCSISRSTLELGLTGKLAMLDGMIFPSICDVARNLAGVWQRNFPDMLTVYVHFPQNNASAAAPVFLRKELERIGQLLGTVGNQSVSGGLTAGKLNRSLAIFNENRALLQALYDQRQRTPHQISTVQLYLLARAGLVLPKEEHIRLLKDALAQIPARSGRPRDCIRVVLEGSFCEQPPLGLLEVLEESGCYIVDDDLLLGLRWYLQPVPTNGDPLGALAKHYLTGRVSTSIAHNCHGSREEAFLEKCRRVRADGVIFCAAKFCEPALLDFVLLKKAAEEAKIPYLAFEFEEKMGVFESIRTQVETFVESILFFS